VNASQLTLDVRAQPPDDHADIDVDRADAIVTAELERELAPTLQPRTCECRTPLVDAKDHDELMPPSCLWCGRAVR
jgi:hypothetical protein